MIIIQYKKFNIIMYTIQRKNVYTNQSNSISSYTQ